MTVLQNEVKFLSQHDIEVQELANQIQKNVLDMETGIRGYAITGDEDYLEPYNLASRSWLDNYNKLHSLVADNGEQQRNLEGIKPLIISWISNSGEYVINHKKENNISALNEHFESNTGKEVTDQLRTQLDSFLAEEKKLTAERIDQLNQGNTNLKITLYAIIILVTAITIATAFFLSNSIVNTIRQVVKTIKSITDSEIDLTTRIEVKTKDETRELAEAMNDLLYSLEKQSWVQKSVAEISTMYQGITDITELTQAFISKLAPLLQATYGVIYLRRSHEGEIHYVKVAGYAIADEERASVSFRLGEGLIGQAALDKRVFLIDKLPEEHIKVTSGLGASSPRNLLIAPILVEDRVEAVVEFATLQPLLSQHITLLDQLQDKFGSAITNVARQMEVERLLGESQILTEELQTQSEELQAQSEELQMQQEQLLSANEFLEEQKHTAEQRALELKIAKDELESYSLQLEMSSQYKTDFLANMSHELRTPLNSILILSQMIMENKDGMDMSEVREFTSMVHSAGGDLLRLIDDILDLSKIEAGKIEILTDEVNVTEIPQTMKNMFNPVAAKKNLTFEVHTDSDVPPIISTDGQRLQQIWKNLLSNAFKFTEEGSVTVRIALAHPENVEGLFGLEVGGPVLSISVTDTGIGIPLDKQQIVFEAFQQVDGTTNRQYGGTGLGLSICREFTHLLGGAIDVQSEPHKGSTFTLYIPSRSESDYQDQVDHPALAEVAASVSEIHEESESTKEDTESKWVERNEAGSSDAQLFKGKKVLLVEDDGRNVFALVTALEKKGVKVQVAENGKQAIDILQEEADFDLIFMDIMMPVMGGYEAMKIIRHDLKMENLPIIALTAKAMKGERDKCMEAGASDYIMKPLNINQLFSLMRVWMTEQVNPN
ncbi:CHASE3 domain-containing protein [Metabacillus rhizolycopersici]|uniref:histidine kinase n=1 Tax=Metabacillus rhizolycopersici TaxID=2875709 RepID=A0ABS7USH0_9BACI|nr:CHASE3 domain-containing protein [Metabacillus rhizolycopersici]MBZ5751246.1 CHASE3 domain-containing protein [Metabacillus rhizolycopersici]